MVPHAREVFRAPKLKRRLGAPGQLSLIVAATAALPVASALGVFGPSATSPGSTSLHVVVVFVVLLFGFRLLGKRELGRLSPFELVTLMLIPEVLSDTLQGQGSLLNGLVGLSTLLFLVLLSSMLAHRFQLVERALESEPTILVADGRIVADALNAERILPDELIGEMRKQGIGRLTDVAWAVLESSGNITFVPKERTGPMQNASDDEAPH